MAPQPAPLGAVFFDIGGTLGTVALSPLKLTLFPSTISLVKTFRHEFGLALGVITNIPSSISPADVRHMLEAEGLLVFFSNDLIITSSDGHGAKPAATIYRFAASKAGLPPSRCLYIGEDAAEVLAAMKTGMSGMVKG